MRNLKRKVEIKEKEYSKLLKRDGNKCKILSLEYEIISDFKKEGEDLVIAGMVSDDTNVLRSFNKRPKRLFRLLICKKGALKKIKVKGY